VIRRLAPLALASLLIAGCGTLSSASALRAWVDQTGFHDAASTLHLDAQHAATALRDAHSSSNDLHTVCEVLYQDARHANSALPSPDQSSTSLLTSAYSALGNGASACYGAAASASQRKRALGLIASGAATLAEARARVAAAS
jgi:hypothetical protein